MSDDVRSAIHKASGVSAVIAAALSPIPLADEIALLPVYGLLVRRIARAHGMSFSQAPLRPIATTALRGLAARATLNLAVAFIPGVAAIANAASAIALTEFLGGYIDASCASPADARALGVRDLLAALRASVRKSPATA